MSKSIRKILPLLLCLLLFACLLPAAYAADDNVEVTTLAELRTELNAGTSKIIVTADITLDADLTIPESCYVKVRHGSTLTVPAGKTLTINGKIEASFNGVIDVVGTLQNNGEIEMFDGGVVDVKGTYAHANGKPIVFNRNGNPDAAMPKFIVEQGANCTLNLFRTEEGLVAEDVIDGIGLNTYSCHSNYDRDNHVVKDTRVYYPSSSMQLEGITQRGIAYLEVHGLDTYTLSSSVEIHVFESTPTMVDMRETTLVVPSGITLTVNGVLKAGRLIINEGGSVIVNEGGYLDIGAGSITVNGSLTLDNTWIDAGFPRTETFSFDNVSYIGNAGMILHLNNGNPNGIAKAIQMASATASEHIQCVVELRTDWTLEGFTDARNIDFVVLPGYTLTVNGTLLLDRFYDRGSVNVSEGGFLYAQSEFQIDPAVTAGMFQLNGTLSVEHTALVPEQLEVVTCGDNGLIDVSFDMHSAEDVLAELETETELFPHFRRSVWALFPWELEEDLTLPGQVRLCVPYGMGYEGSLLIPAGKSLTIPAGSELYARGAGPETQQAVVEVWGEIVNNGSIVLDWGDTLGDIALAGSGSVSGSGSIIRDGQPYDLVEEHAAYAALTAACAVSYNEPTEYDIEGTHVFTIRDNLTIPANLSVFAIDSTFEVASSGYFTIAGGGELIAGSLESFGSTAVNGSLHLERDCRILDNPVVLNGELVMTLDAWVNLMEFINAPDPDAVAAKFSFGDDSLLDIWVEPTEESISDSLDFPMFHIPHIRETYCVTFPWTLDRDRELQQDTRLLFHYGGDATGMLIIPAGMTLTVPEGSELFPRGAGENGEAIVKVAGMLINNGNLILQYTRAGWADVELVDGGIYAGRGIVKRGEEDYAIWNDPLCAQLVLPADLKTLSSEALADGDFFYVYIPGGTTSIASDAFGDRTALVVFGVPGSEADSFAADKGFLFAPVEPAETDEPVSPAW